MSMGTRALRQIAACTRREVNMMRITLLTALALVLLAAPAQARLEGEQFSQKGPGLVVQGSSASGGEALLFGQNGAASTSFRGPAARFVLRARAGRCGGHMVFAIDGRTALDRVITQSTWQPYGVTVSVGTGQHTLSVAQDDQPASCDNRLRLDYVEAITSLGWRSAGQPPLQDRDAAAAVVHRAEVRPDNAGPNSYVPTDAQLAAFYSTSGSAENPWYRYVTGRPGLQSPSTDDLIQWAAIKWGITTDWVRAEAVDESYWHQSAIGNNGASKGIMQMKATASNGAEPLRWQSTAWNLDYYGATIRFYFDGYCSWCTPNYTSGHEWASIGAWFAPSPWGNQGAQDYVSRVQAELANRAWEQPGF
jgi:hypothetical protein